MKNKEELIDELYRLHGYTVGRNDFKKLIDEFFESNVCIPKGENRHPYADVYHAWLEGVNCEIVGADGWIKQLKDISALHFVAGNNSPILRIKPSEPIYEWQYCHDNCGGKNIVADKYYTDYEYETMVDHKERCIKLPWTKRERK